MIYVSLRLRLFHQIVVLPVYIIFNPLVLLRSLLYHVVAHKVLRKHYGWLLNIVVVYVLISHSLHHLDCDRWRSLHRYWL